jgi:hypothetical protein
MAIAPAVADWREARNRNGRASGGIRQASSLGVAVATSAAMQPARAVRETWTAEGKTRGRAGANRAPARSRYRTVTMGSGEGGSERRGRKFRT